MYYLYDSLDAIVAVKGHCPFNYYKKKKIPYTKI